MSTDDWFSSTCDQSGEWSAPPTMRAPLPTECELCAGSPAVLVRMRRQASYLLFMKFWDYSGTYCRDCGIEMFRQAQNASIAGGWWGIPAFAVNVWTLIRNARAYRKLRALPVAMFRDPSVAVPNDGPLPQGPPIFGRSGFLYLIAILCCWIVIANLVN